MRRRREVGWALGAALAVVLLAAPLAAQGRIVAVHVRGSRRFAAAEVVAASGLPAGAAYSPAAVEAAERRLAATGAFREVDPLVVPAYGGVILDWEMTDAPRFVPARFEGFHRIGQAEIAAALAQIPLYHGVLPLLKPGLAHEVERALERLLRAHHMPGRIERRYSGPGGAIAAVVFRVRR